LELEGEEIMEIAVDDSKAIEKKPGNYKYVVKFGDTGSIGAEGEKSWGVETYKWRIRGNGNE